MVQTDRKKVLISTYACLPDMGSEPGMGWNWVSRLAKYHDVWLLTEENRYAPVVRQYIQKNPELQGHLHVVGIPRERYGEEIWSHFYYWTYRKWQKKAYHKALELQKELRFDLVHQLNMIGYREPGYLWKLPVPFVWGPVGGHAQMPWAYLTSLGLKGAVHYGIRNIINTVQMRCSVRVRHAVKNANILFAATKEDQIALKKIHGRDSILLNEQGTDPALNDKQLGLSDSNSSVLRIVWCGLFLARKGLPLGLEAIKRAAKHVKIELHIIGSGVCEQEWKQVAEDLGVQNLCRWYGHIEHKQVLDVMRKSDVLLFTSLLEGTPAVVTEAIQMGMPVICHDMCGFGACVDNNSGIKVKPVSPKLSIQGFSDALIKLSKDRQYLINLSQGALARAKELAWDDKVNLMRQFYDQTLLVDRKN